MKKHICKIWSVVLAALLCMALLPVSVFAAESAVATATIPVSVSVSGEEGTLESDIPTETYTFKLATTNGAPMPASDTVTITGAGSASFSIDYERVGVYEYTLTQDSTELSGTNSTCGDRGNYDSTVYYVTVSVVNADDGSIGVIVAAHKDSTTGDKCDTEFVNTYDPVSYPGLTVEKTAQVAEDYKAAAGDTITYEIKVTNNGNVAVNNITVSDDLTGDKWTIETLAVDASQTFTTTYVVTEADVLAGSVKNVATASGTDPDGTPTEGKDEEEVPTEDKNSHLTVTKTATSTPADGNAYQSGETITYSITVTNDGNLTVSSITVKDDLTGESWTIDSLAVNESKTFTTSYVVTEADVLAGSVKNVATASGTDPDGTPTEGEGSDEVTTEDPNGHLTVTKTTTSTPKDGEAYQPGETITYEITVTNDGNLTITNITVTDELTEDEWAIESLAPGESQTFEAEYTVTESDAEAGSITNTATATGTSPDPSQGENGLVTADPGTATDPTAPTPETETESETEAETETESETEASTDSPQTGDNSPIELYTALMLLAVVAIAGMLIYSRRRKAQ
ncbi:MAG: DUF11 domain-containing protein [Clostridiales bacterium]|nr:DUF11 domain-containing protein [Clostridiales bacterium]